MKSFEESFIERQLITQQLLQTIRLIGEYKGKQELFKEQAPQALETLRQAAIIQSTESSNRIEGITVPLERIKKLVAEKTRPRDRSKQEIAGYRDVLNTIHASYTHIPFWHQRQHNLLPWWEYFLGVVVLSAYREFEERVGLVTTTRGAKREMILDAVQRLPKQFQFADVERACPGVSRPTINRALAELRKTGQILCIKPGRDAVWEKI